MKVLVIPDVHLKPKMFYRAAAIMHQGIADRAVCLMDIADDWGQEYNVVERRFLSFSCDELFSIV